jgi:hypothetical protein
MVRRFELPKKLYDPLLILSVGLFSVLTYFTVEGSVSLRLALLVIGASAGLSKAIPIKPILRSSCCFGVIVCVAYVGTIPKGMGGACSVGFNWGIGLKEAPESVVSICVDESCSVASYMEDPANPDDLVLNPLRGPTNIQVVQSPDYQARTKIFAFKKIREADRSYNLRITMADSRVLKKKVRPGIWWCGGKRRGDKLLMFSFEV